MRKLSIICGALSALVAIAFASVFLVSGEQAEQAGLINLCSDISRDAMKSPSSYKMNSASARISIGLPELGAREEKSQDIKEAILSGRIPYRLANVSIKQEAMNPLGVSLAGSTYCRYSILGGSDYASYKIISINIDGKEISEMDIIILSKAREYEINNSGFRNRIRHIEYLLTSKI